MARQTLREIRLRQERLQNTSGMYRGLLRMELREGGRKARGLVSVLQLGLTAGRFMASLLQRRGK